MADIISGDDIAELMEAFARFDTDNDGLINTIELRHVLHYLGQNPTDAELQELAYAMDTDESGKIDLPEFLHMMAKRYLLPHRDYLIQKVHIFSCVVIAI